MYLYMYIVCIVVKKQGTFELYNSHIILIMTILENENLYTGT